MCLQCVWYLQQIWTTLNFMHRASKIWTFILYHLFCFCSWSYWSIMNCPLTQLFITQNITIHLHLYNSLSLSGTKMFFCSEPESLKIVLILVLSRILDCLHFMRVGLRILVGSLFIHGKTGTQIVKCDIT